MRKDERSLRDTFPSYLSSIGGISLGGQRLWLSLSTMENAWSSFRINNYRRFLIKYLGFSNVRFLKNGPVKTIFTRLRLNRNRNLLRGEVGAFVFDKIKERIRQKTRREEREGKRRKEKKMGKRIRTQMD